MSDDKDFNPDDTHFSDEELEAALAGFEKEFENDTDTGDDDQADSAADAKSIDNGADTQAADDISSSVADAVNEAMADVVDPSAGFDNELAGLLGDKAKMALIVTRIASADLLAAFCQLSDISAACIGANQGAVAVLKNLDGDAPEAAAKDLTTVVSGMPAVLAINRADKLEATMYLQGKVGQTFAPPVLLTSTAPFVEDLLLGITDVQGVRDSGVETVDSASLTRDDAMKILAEHTRFGRGSSSIE